MNDKPDIYYIIEEGCERKIAVGKCRFITRVAPVKKEAEALSLIAGEKEKYPDASHHVYAYRLGKGSDIRERSSDDREPSGTGGLPVLAAIRKKDLTETVVVVSRYFGGVKLGVGGLIRAYRRAAEEGLNALRTVCKLQMIAVRISLSYENIGALIKLLSSCGGEVSTIEYKEGVIVEAVIPPKSFDYFKNTLTDITRGVVNITLK